MSDVLAGAIAELTRSVMVEHRTHEDRVAAAAFDLTHPAHRHRLRAELGPLEIDVEAAGHVVRVLIESDVTIWCDVTDLVTGAESVATAPGPR